MAATPPLLRAAAPASGDPTEWRPCELCGGVTFTRRVTHPRYTIEECEACALMRIHPPPSDADLAAVYDAHYFDGWAADDDLAISRALKLRTFRRLLAQLPPPAPGARLLDLGTAYGFMMDAAADTGFEPYGVELVPEAAAVASARFGGDRVFVGTFEDAGFGGLTQPAFDCITACDFIEHVRDPRAVLLKAAALLRPGGYLLLVTPDAASLTRRLLGASWPHYHLEHLYYFRTENLVRTLAECGFTTRRTAPAIKALSIDYMAANLRTRADTPLRGAAARGLSTLPASLRRRPIWMRSGQLEIVAVRDGSG